MLVDDPNFISINIIENSTQSYDITYDIKFKSSQQMLRDMMGSSQNPRYKNPEPEEKYGLYIRSEEDIIVATPIDESYPRLVFQCTTTVCTIISSYRDKFGLAVSFNASKLDKWQDIWLKANSKIDSMIKW